MKLINRLTYINVKHIKALLCSSLLLLSHTTFAFAEQAAIDLNHLIPDAPTLNAQAYILIDYNSRQILAEKNADIRRNPASLTKIMTSYVIGNEIKSHKISVDDMVVVSHNARSINPQFKGSSLMFLREGDKVKVSDLNRGIIIQSGNDACVAMAEHVAGNEQTFISLMNNYANSLGLKNTHYQTVHGLDAENQYSTAHDIALLSIALIRDVPDEYKTYSEKEFTFNGIKQPNRNRLLWDKSIMVDGIKTGHTAGAGYNLVSSATQNNMRLIAVVMGSQTDKERIDESKQLLTWGFRFFETVSPLQANKAILTKRVWYSHDNYLNLGVKEDIYITVPRGRANALTAEYTLNNNELHAPIKKGEVIGMVEFKLDGNLLQQQPLIAMSDINKGGLFNQLVDYIKLLFNHWFGWFA